MNLVLLPVTSEGDQRLFPSLRQIWFCFFWCMCAHAPCRFLCFLTNANFILEMRYTFQRLFLSEEKLKKRKHFHIETLHSVSIPQRVLWVWLPPDFYPCGHSCVRRLNTISNSTVETRPLGSMDVSVIHFPTIIQNYILGHIIYPLK